MSTHNMSFHGEIRKILTWYPFLSRPMVSTVFNIQLVSKGTSKKWKKTYMCVGSEHTIIRNHLGMRRVSAHWVPHHLMSDQADCSSEITTANLSQFHMEGENCLSRIVPIDEMWGSHMSQSWIDNLLSGILKAHQDLKVSSWTIKIEYAYDLCIWYSGCSHDP